MTLGRTAWLVGVLTLLILAETPTAQTPGADPKEPRRSLIGTELTVVNYCVRDVRRSRPGSAFDAYVGIHRTMRYFGTEAEIAAFKRCMEAQDFPLEAK